MENATFQAMLKQASEEMERLMKERQALDQKLIALRQTIRGLEALLDADADPLALQPGAPPMPKDLEGLPKLGLTDAVRKLIQTSPVNLSARTIRDQLVVFGYRKLPKGNPMAAIHGVIKRLLKNGEIRVFVGTDGKPTYEWNEHPIDNGRIGRYTMRMGRGGGFIEFGTPPSIIEKERQKK